MSRRYGAGSRKGRISQSWASVYACQSILEGRYRREAEAGRSSSSGAWLCAWAGALRPSFMTHICGARRRYGRGICQKPTPEGKRCRMHGGAPGSGIVTPEGFARCQAAKVEWLRANKKIPPWMHSMGGKARAATALRGAHLGGAFLPGSKPKQQAG